MAYYMTPYRRMARWADWLFDDKTAESARENREVHVPVNVQMDEEIYVVTALVPGLSADDLDIEVLNDTITISGELKAISPAENGHLLREIPSGKFRRVFRLPVALDAKAAEASIQDGILTLRVPKAEEARAKRITVSTK